MVNPRYAIISVGYRNVRHLPNPKVEERCRAMGSRLYRTDEDGAVEFTTDGEKIWVKTYSG